jgi:hypothetical protein
MPTVAHINAIPGQIVVDKTAIPFKAPAMFD